MNSNYYAVFTFLILLATNCFGFFGISLKAQSCTGEVKLKAVPSSSPVLGNDELDYTLVLQKDDGTPIDSINGVKFKIATTANGYTLPGAIDVSNSFLGDEADINVEPKTLIEIGTDTISVLIELLDSTINVSGSGELARINCIATIDDVFKTAGDCTPFTLNIFDIEIIKKEQGESMQGDDGTIIWNYNSLVDPIETETISEVFFCAKCDVDNLDISAVCSTDDLGFFTHVSFVGVPGITYTVKADDGVNTDILFGNTGTYVFGPYTNSSNVTVAIIDSSAMAICELPISVNCECLQLETCFDNIQNQNETGIDCGGICSPCLSCGLTMDAEVICEDANNYSVLFNVQGSATYTIADNVGNSNSYVAGNTPIFGTYTKGTTTRFVIYDLVDSLNCHLIFDAKYKDCSTCNFAPTNDFCPNALPIVAGENGPYNNYCANNTTDPSLGVCYIDSISHGVWFSVTGTGENISLWASDCSGVLGFPNYEDDLQITIYDDCLASNEIACNDDFYDWQPRVSFPTTLGMTYYVLVDGYGRYDPTGEFCLELFECQVFDCTFDNITAVSCQSVSDGAIDLNVSGGNAPYSFRWSNNSALEDPDNLNIGDYTVTVTDNNGCTCANTANVGIAPDALQVDTTTTEYPIGAGWLPFAYSVADLDVNGGITPYTYTWSSTGYIRTTINSDTTLSVLFTDIALWYLTITDDEGCETYMDNVPDDVLALSSILVTPATTNTSTDGAIDISVEGGTTPYTIQWVSGVDGAIFTTEDINNLLSGWYQVSVEDNGTPIQNITNWIWIPEGSSNTRGRDGLLLNDNTLKLNNYPNPFQSSSNLLLENNDSTPRFVTLSIYDVQGNEIDRLYEGALTANELKAISFDASQLPNGMYIALLQAANGETQYLQLLHGY